MDASSIYYYSKRFSSFSKRLKLVLCKENLSNFNITLAEAMVGPEMPFGDMEIRFSNQLTHGKFEVAMPMARIILDILSNLCTVVHAPNGKQFVT